MRGGSSPAADLALIQANPRTVPKRCSEHVIQGANALGLGDNVNIIEEGENSFPVEERWL